MLTLSMATSCCHDYLVARTHPVDAQRCEWPSSFFGICIVDLSASLKGDPATLRGASSLLEPGGGSGEEHRIRSINKRDEAVRRLGGQSACCASLGTEVRSLEPI